MDEKDIKVQVCVHAFDLLYLNGKSLVREPLRERRRLMHEHFNVVEGQFVFATSKDMSDIDDLQVFLDESVKDGTEGLMVKVAVLTILFWIFSKNYMEKSLQAGTINVKMKHKIRKYFNFPGL